MTKKTVRDVQVAGRRVFLRCDFNVPQDDQGNITDDLRIRAALPTIRYLLENRARLIMASHLGRPKGFDKKWTLAPIAQRLSELLNQPVAFCEDCIGPKAQDAAAKLGDGQAVLLENVRFYKEETDNDPSFAAQLASLAEIYVNDAFGAAHRAHASTEGIAHLIPGVMGFLMEKEVKFLSEALVNPARPALAVLGGAKVSDKIEVIRNLAKKVDRFLIGGGMVFTFLKAKGVEIGRSILDEQNIAFAAEMLNSAPEKFDLANDFVAAKQIEIGAATRIATTGDFQSDDIGADIGPDTCQRFSTAIHSAGTVIWNGPMGVFELEPFANGTKTIVHAMEGSSGVTIVGGGDTAAAFEKFGDPSKVSHVSTGGGASLELLEGKLLPGIEALQNA